MPNITDIEKVKQQFAGRLMRFKSEKIGYVLGFEGVNTKNWLCYVMKKH